MAKSLPLVEVRWRDSAFHRGWSDAAGKRREMSVSDCRSVGYLISRDAKSVKLAMHTADDNAAFGDGMTIPTSAVRTIRRLKGAK